MKENSLLFPEQRSKEERTARMLLSVPAQMRQHLLSSLDQSSRALVSTADPQAIIDEMGTQAGELFRLNEAFAGLVASFLTSEGDADGLAKLAEINARLPAIATHEDGTVTLL